MPETVHTYKSALDLAGVSVPPHLLADAEVPVLDGVQAQGDLLVRILHGEATGNTHWLHAGFDSPGVRWRRATPAGEPAGTLVVGHVQVPAGQSALLIHTDEHGANGIAPGEYAIHRKRRLDVVFAARQSLVED